jgi:hypothetical protein
LGKSLTQPAKKSKPHPVAEVGLTGENPATLWLANIHGRFAAEFQKARLFDALKYARQYFTTGIVLKNETG